MNILLTTIGHRDIEVNGNVIAKDFKDEKGTHKVFKKNCEKILENIKTGNQDIDRIKMPMIEPVLNFIEEFENIKIKNIIVFATNQKDEKFQQTDTVIAFEIIKLVIEKKYENVKCRKIDITANPNDYDKMFKIFDKKILYIKKSYSKTQKDMNYYALCAGGIPACITAMLFNGIKHLKSDFIPYYKSEGDLTPIKLKLTSLVSKEFVQQQLKYAKETFDFNGIVNLLKNLNIEMAYIAELLLYKFNNNSEKAKEIYLKINNSNLDNNLKTMFGELFLNPCEEKELFFKLEIKLKRKELLDFIIYLGIIVEIILTKSFKQISDNKITRLNIEDEQAFNDMINTEEYEEILIYLLNDEELKKSGKLTTKNITPSKPVIAALIKYHYERNGNSKFNKIYFFNKKMVDLVNLRNRVIHKNEGISLDKIVSIYSPQSENITENNALKIIDDLFEEIKTILELIGINLGVNFFKKALEFIII